jgi:diguanylate cyclase (GGDEF)-like protein/PAS domain S-box-containing protein
MNDSGASSSPDHPAGLISPAPPAAGESRGLETLCAALCQLAEHLVPGSVASVMRLAEDGRLHVLAAPSVSAEVRAAFDGLAPGPQAGSCGTAAFSQTPVFAHHIPTDPRWAPLAEAARAVGLLSCWSVPLLDRSGRVIGTFALSSREARAPTPEQEDLLYRLGEIFSRLLEEEKLSVAYSLFAEAFAALGEGVVLSDAEARVLAINPAFTAITGYGAPDILGTNCNILQGEETDPETRARIAAALRGGETFRGRILNYRKDGTPFWNQLTITPRRDAAGHTTHFIGIIRDVTEEVRREEELRLAAYAFDAQEAIVIIDAKRRVIRVNAAFTRLTGYSEEEVRGRSLERLRTARQDAEFYARVWERLEREGQWQGEIWWRSKNGEERPQWVTVTAVRDEARGAVTHYVGHFLDLAELHARQAELEYLALHDPLTGLHNRRAFEQELGRAIARAERRRRLLALVLIDLDDFKPINDAYGHDVGDAVLTAFAERLGQSLRRTDFIARLGGDEFVLLLEELTDVEDLEKILGQLTAVLGRPYVPRTGLELSLDVSMGVALFPFDAEASQPQLLLRRADQALYRAKGAKGRRPRPWAFAGEERARQHRAQLLLGEGRIEVWYQPLWHARSGRIVAIEALARLRETSGQLLLPGQFLPSFGETELRHLTRAVLDQALADLAALDRRGLSLDLTVNLDPLTIEGNLIDEVGSALARHGLPARRLVLEVLEDRRFEDTPRAQAVLAALRAHGVRLALDDVGVGYSSLLRLKQMNVDKIKIDQAFVRHLEARPEDLRFVLSLVDLAAELGLDVVAEGVETAAILDALTVLGIPYLQGYAIAPPMPFPSLERLLDAPLPLVPAAGPATFFGLYAGHLAAHSAFKKAFRQAPQLLDFTTLGDAAQCPATPSLRRLGVAPGSPLEQAHAAYHAAVAALGAVSRPPPPELWEALEAAHQTYCHECLLAFAGAAEPPFPAAER